MIVEAVTLWATAFLILFIDENNDWPLDSDLDTIDGMWSVSYTHLYNGIYLVAKKNGEWQVVGKIEGMNDSCRLFEQESYKVIWVYNTDHVTRDVYKRQGIARRLRAELWGGIILVIIGTKILVEHLFLSLIHIYYRLLFLPFHTDIIPTIDIP